MSPFVTGAGVVDAQASIRAAPVLWQSLALEAGVDVALALDVIPDPARVMDALRAEIPWESHFLKLFGREVAAPRLSCWIGDAEAVYTYSRTRFEPRPWTPCLAVLRRIVEQTCAQPFNSVLCNLYRDGSDYMGWHSDDEPELGATPLIASLSFGATRRFRLRHKRDHTSSVEVNLTPGSLLRMGGLTQQRYQHSLPRALRVRESRINLTFRQIRP